MAAKRSSPAMSASSAPARRCEFFYETDLKLKLEDRLPRFKDIIFHESSDAGRTHWSALSD